MANRRDTFAKRQRETELKERARAKLARRMAKRNEVRTTKGPGIAVDEAAHVIGPDGMAPAAAPPMDPEGASGADPADPADPME